ncbi:MAG: hypothetical protein QOJ41_2460 [Acidobacteriaceae bacterium]|jgi:hypothetical protein|nr:hypothetical protein [Acidobacteriaceae bacterium]
MSSSVAGGSVVRAGETDFNDLANPHVSRKALPFGVELVGSRGELLAFLCSFI